MNVRELTPEEHIHFRGICKTVFLTEEREDIRKMMKNPKKHAFKQTGSVRWGYFDDKNRLQSAFLVKPFTIRMNEKDVKMGGVGAVVTRPEARGQGGIRKIYEKALPAMYDAGQIFSVLYPFSYEYYRTFGYEMCYPLQKLRIPMYQLAKYPYPKNIEPFEPGDDTAPYAQIYAAFIKKRNLAVVRNKNYWEHITYRDPYNDVNFTYLIRDDANIPIAYILYDAENCSEDGNTLAIKECCWTTPEGLKYVFGFLSKLGAEYEAIQWDAPYDINMHALCTDSYEIDWKVAAGGMNRLVNVPAGLQTLCAPQGSGQVNIGITDTFLPINTGTYNIQWENSTLTVKKQDAPPDMETTVQTMAQLVTGFITPEEALYKNCTKIHSAHENLSQLFPKRSMFMTERF